MKAEIACDILKEPFGSVYKQLLSAAVPFCSTCSLVVRKGYDSAEGVTRALHRLSAWLVSDERRSAWPGTELLLGDTARVLTYRFDNGLALELANIGTSLYGWKHPELPEDLALLRADGSVILGSIAHERDAFVTLRFEEQTALLPVLELDGLVQPSPLRT